MRCGKTFTATTSSHDLGRRKVLTVFTPYTAKKLCYDVTGFICLKCLSDCKTLCFPQKRRATRKLSYAGLRTPQHAQKRLSLHDPRTPPASRKRLNLSSTPKDHLTSEDIAKLRQEHSYSSEPVSPPLLECPTNDQASEEITSKENFRKKISALMAKSMYGRAFRIAF